MSIDAIIRAIQERERVAASTAASAATASATARYAAALEAKQVELDALTAQYGAANAQVIRLGTELDRAREQIAALMALNEPPVVVDPPVIIDPPPSSGDGSAIINAHDYLGRTAEENLAIPRFDWLRANRAPRTDAVGTTIYKAGEINALHDLDLYAEWASCIGFSPDFPLHRQGPLFVSNVGHQMQPGAQQNTKWGERLWSMSDVDWLDCDYTEIPYEHANYVNLSGSTSITRSTARDCGGHFQYVCLRNQPTLRPDGTWQYPPGNAVPTAPQVHIIEDCHTRNMNNRAARGSGGVELFNLGTLEHQASVYIRNCTDVVALPYQLHTGTGDHQPIGASVGLNYVRSYNALTVKTYADQKPDGVTGPHSSPIALLNITNCLYDYTQSNKPLMLLNDCDKIVFDSCTFIGRDLRQPFIDVDNQLDEGHEPTDEFVLANCSAQGVSLRWTLPGGGTRTHTLDTRGRFIRLRAGVVVENVPYNPTHRMTQMESASA
jgi:hypothetical protein